MLGRSATSAAAVALGALLSACTASTGGATAAAPGSVTIQARDFSFGDKMYVAPGGLVIVKNIGASVHSLVGLDAKGSTADIPAGGKIEFSAPSKEGAYVFTCGHHDQMAGVLVVSTTAKPIQTSSFAVHPAP